MAERRHPAVEVEHYEAADYLAVIVRAGNQGTQRVVPPSGERYAYDRQLWARRVEVSVSPTGRSVRVWVDGVEVPRA